MESNITRRDVSPADCDVDPPAAMDCTLGPCSCDAVPVDSITLSSTAGDEIRYEFADGWWRPTVDELPQFFPTAFRWDVNGVEIESAESGVGVVSPCCGE